MKKNIHIAILIYGDSTSRRNALTEEKYKALAEAFVAEGDVVDSVLFHDDIADRLAAELARYDAILVWVNPIEQGQSRLRLDALLTDLSHKGCFVSTHPEVILKMGTKDVLFKTKDMPWGGDTHLYTGYDDFAKRFPEGLKRSTIRVLKQYRGNGGNGVFKISNEPGGDRVSIIHAIAGSEERVLSMEQLLEEFRPSFSNHGMWIDQEWNGNITNGMIRCYLTGNKVSGFGYQEINALYSLKDQPFIPPGKRYYYTERCGLFADLKDVMEKEWVPQLQRRLSIEDHLMPVIWDADFFINHFDSDRNQPKYTLCEINVSCVSPFPPSAIPYMVNEVRKRVEK